MVDFSIVRKTFGSPGFGEVVKAKTKKHTARKKELLKRLASLRKLQSKLK